jgi:uncharacterized protein (TIGR00730 family)
MTTPPANDRPAQQCLQPLSHNSAEAIVASLDHVEHRQLAIDIVQSAIDAVSEGADELDLRIINSALREMREAFTMFRPFRGQRKVTIFGSARTAPNDPLFAQAELIARLFAERNWMVITGAGPGIMEAAMIGAGKQHSIGVKIRLPFEQTPNPIIAGDPKFVEMKYFFTRKLALIKEAEAFVSLPGGFGTLDELFELLTLTQTGKGRLVPIVLLDVPGDPFWESWMATIDSQLVDRGYINGADLSLIHIAENAHDAVAHIEQFWRNFHSLRFVGDRLLIRHHADLDDATLTRWQHDYGDLCSSGTITRANVTDAERDDDDALDESRVALRFDGRRVARLRTLVDELNLLPTRTITADSHSA